MKKIISVVLAVMMLLSCFAGLSFNAFAADTPQNGWYEDDGDWQYYKNGEAVTGWQYIGKNWYYFGEDGWMFYDDWYYIEDENFKDAYYVFGKDGAMLSGGWVSLTWEYSDGDSWTDWCYTDKSGACLEGWQKISGKWYYLSPYAYSQGMYEIPEESDTYYYFGKDCAMCTGWIKADYYGGIKSEEVAAESTFDAEAIHHYYGGTTWLYANGSGVLQTGWKQIKGTWYYFDEDHRMVRGPVEIDEQTYYFNENGAWVKNGWCELYGSWYYIKDGETVTDWQKINNVWYYFDEYGDMVRGGYKIEGKDYLFDGNGAWIKNPAAGWHKLTATMTMSMNDQKYTESAWYYVKKDGTLATGWQKISNVWYYFMPIDFYEDYYVADNEESDVQTGFLGRMFSNTTLNDNGKYYAFDANGAMITKTGWAKFEAPAYAKSAYGATDEWVYVKNSNGELVQGWKKISGKWYYFEEYNAIMFANSARNINGTFWFFDKSGALVEKAGWAKAEETYYSSSGSNTYTIWYYLNADGSCYSGWKQVGGKWYYMHEVDEYSTPYMVTGWQYIDGTYYQFDYNSGALIDPEAPVSNMD